MTHIEMLEEVILPAAVLAGGFGDDAELVTCDSHEGSHGKDQFASVVMFSSMEIRAKNKTEKLFLVVKFNQESEVLRKSVLTDLQLQNELFMYEHFLPFLRINEQLIPKFYYGVATKGKFPELDVILLQDLCKSHYHVRSNWLDLDYNHIVVSLQQLAKLHASSFVAKNNQKEMFFEKVSHFIETQWVSEKLININVLIKPVVKKVVKEMVSNNESVIALKSFLLKMSDPLSYAKALIQPTEPLCVACHGDFCNYNILFMYNQVGKVTAAKFVDFGSSRYSSPVIDLSLFLFFNTTSATRRKHLDNFLTEYYNVLKSLCGGIQIPTIEMFEQEFLSKAVYGFLECCLRIPTAFSEPTDWEELATMTEEQVENYFLIKCDRNATDLLKDILRDLIHFKCQL